MYKAYRFRLYPSEPQKILINKTFGCTRFVYNYFLNKCKNDKYIKAYDMCKEVKELLGIYPFLKEVDSSSLRNAIFDLKNSYKNFFESRSRYPKFKSKYEKQSYRTNCIRSAYKESSYCNIQIDLINKLIKLPKLGFIKIRGYRNLKEFSFKIINATVERENTGKYYVSVLIEEDIITKEKVIPVNVVGIDLGIKDLVVTSNGERFTKRCELLKYEKRIKRLQRKLSRQIKGSNNYNKTKIRLARLHSKVKNSRKHRIIEIVNKLVRENDIIVSETLKVKNMSKNHHLAKSILDASFNKIINQLKWKCELLGKYFYQIDTFYPSSKTCSLCGTKTNKTNNLSVREWKCEECGFTHDRDMNASINILGEGLKLYYQF